MTKVIKFGGSSLASGEQFQKVLDIIKDDVERKVIVVSAPGKRFANDTKVTDLLIQYANRVLAQEDSTNVSNEIQSRYQNIGEYFNLNIQDMQSIYDQINSLKDQKYPNNEYLMADFKAHGEMLNAQLLAKVMKHLNYPARFIDPKKVGIVLSGEPNDATVSEETYDNLAQLDYEPNEYLVFPGFFGRTKDGHTATFARGGSDITGSIVARGLKIPTYENFTDVDSIYTANPNIIENPEPIKEMSYREMRELSYAGFSVFNDEAIIPAIQGNVTINVKNTNHPAAKGTLIVPTEGYKPAHPITGISGSNDFVALYLHKYLLNKEVGFTVKILEIIAKHGVSYEHMPSGIDDLTIIFNSKNISADKMKMIQSEIEEVLHPDSISWIMDYSILMVVGEGLYHEQGATAKTINALNDEKISIKMLNQGASQTSLMIGTKMKDSNRAIKAIYNTFFN